MRRRELNERSPLRLLEQSIHGGLGQGELGVVVARHGVGKTAFLVGVALDDLMRGRKVLHVALDEPVEHVLAYYEEIFQDLAHTQKLEDVWKVRTEAERNRHIHSYQGVEFTPSRLEEILTFLKGEGDFVPVALVLEGFDFGKASSEELAELRRIAAAADAVVWLSAVTHREAPRDEAGVPEPVSGHAASLDVILALAHDGDAVQLSLLKDHDNPRVGELKLALDPRTMLLVEG
jgi:hypothetical protein